jgi:hypothetical protein
MHGAWGALSSLIKKQEAAKRRKASLKYDLQKRRDSFLKKKAIQKLEFPEISDSEMKTIKDEIRKKHKREWINNILVNLLLLICSFFLIYYVLINIKW